MNILENISQTVTTEKQRIMYKYYLHEIFIGKANIKKEEDIYYIKWLSTINFQTDNKSNDEELEAFDKDNELYKKSRIALEKIKEKTYIPQLWSNIFINIIKDIQSTWGRWVNLHAIPTSKWFYEKICERLEKEKIIEGFEFNAYNNLVIQLDPIKDQKSKKKPEQ
jgi:hypothetical protein